MYCSNCGNLLEEDARFCNKCGTKIIVEEESKKETKDQLSIWGIVFLFIIIIAIGVVVKHKSGIVSEGDRTAQSGRETPFAEDLERQNKEILEGILIEENSEIGEITREEEKVKVQKNEYSDSDTDEYIYMRDRFKEMSEEEIWELGESQLYKLDAVAGSLDALSYHQYTSYEDKSYEELCGLYSDVLFYYYEQCSKNDEILPIGVPQIEYYDEQDPRGYSSYGYYKAEQFAYDWITREVFSLTVKPEDPLDETGDFWYEENDSIYCMVNGLGIPYVENVSTEIIGYDNGWYDIMMTIDGGYEYVHLVATLNELEQYPEQYYWKFIKIHKVEKVTK